MTDSEKKLLIALVLMNNICPSTTMKWTVSRSLPDNMQLRHCGLWTDGSRQHSLCAMDRGG
jgi:hypothetical protein